MPLTEKANKRIREEKTEKILDAAARVFARKGTATTMADLAAAAGISQGLAYRYFPGKEAVFAAMVEKQAQSWGGVETRLTAMEGTPGERLRLLVSCILESRRAQPEFYQVFDHILHDETVAAELREVVTENGRAVREMLRQLIVEGQATREVAGGDPDQLLVAVMACFDGLMRWRSLLAPEVDSHFPDAEIIGRMLRPVSPRRGPP